MLHESVKLKLCMGSQKFMNGYLGIHTWMGYIQIKVSKPLTDGG